MQIKQKKMMVKELFEKNEYPNALNVLEEILGEHPDDAESIQLKEEIKSCIVEQNRTKILALSGVDSELAKNMFDKLISEQPDTPEYLELEKEMLKEHFKLGKKIVNELSEEKKYSKARDIISGILEKDSANKEFLQMKEEIERKIVAQNLENVRSVIEKADFGLAKSLLAKLISDHSDTPEYVELEKDLLKAYAVHKNMSARELFEKKEYSKSLGIIEEILAEIPCDKEGINLKVEIHEKIEEISRLKRMRELRATAMVVAIIFMVIMGLFATIRYSYYRLYKSDCDQAQAAFAARKYGEAVKFFELALKVPVHDDDDTIKKSLDEARTFLERKKQFDDALEKGRHSIGKKDWFAAKTAYMTALSIPGYENESEACEWLKKCQDYFEELHINNKAKHDKAISDGRTALGSKDYVEALKFFHAALKIPEYENEQIAVMEIDQIELILDRKTKFDAAMDEGAKYLNKKIWTSAATAFRKALEVPGYANNKEAQKGIKATEFGLLTLERKSKFNNFVGEGNNFLKQKDWGNAEKSFKAALSVRGHENDSRALSCLKAAQDGATRKKQSEEGWKETKDAAWKLISDAENKSLHMDRRYDSADAALALIQKMSDSNDISFLSDSYKSEIANLKSQILSMQSNLVLIPPSFEMVKKPSPGTEHWASEIRQRQTGIEMVYVAPGEFMAGPPASEKGGRDKALQHKVRLDKGYYIGKYEVTQDQWEKVMGYNPSKFKDMDLPVDNISNADCQIFCRKISSDECKTFSTKIEGSFRLPTEAEWEYAARGGNKSQGFIYCGSNNLDEVGWYDDNSGKNTHEVGKKKANEIGLFDMSGNVSEFCSDWGNNPSETAGTSVSSRVFRGGSWHNSKEDCRSDHRGLASQDEYGNHLGFRLVMDIPSINK